MAAIQLNFSLRTSTKCKTVHLVGNWDGYKGQLPLSKDSSKAGAWKGAFRFQATTLQQGQRYWYYYIIDGYHVSHNPAKPFTTEPTTGRNLNILDVPQADSTTEARSARSERRSSKAVAQGRPLSPSRIQCPVPTKPHALTRSNISDVDSLTQQFAGASFDDESDSDSESDVPSLASSAVSSRASSVSSVGSCCTCERYGITRKGDRVKLDCGGSRCGSDVDSCSDSEEEETYRVRSTRRQGVVIRN